MTTGDFTIQTTKDILTTCEQLAIIAHTPKNLLPALEAYSNNLDLLLWQVRRRFQIDDMTIGTCTQSQLDNRDLCDEVHKTLTALIQTIDEVTFVDGPDPLDYLRSKLGKALELIMPKA